MTLDRRNIFASNSLSDVKRWIIDGEESGSDARGVILARLRSCAEQARSVVVSFAKQASKSLGDVTALGVASAPESSR